MITGQGGGPLPGFGNYRQYGSYTTVLGGPYRLLRWREPDRSRADNDKNSHTYEFSA
ncbi:MAG: hypothetical protein WA869_23390 [Alloacidobacterium sp.]